MIKEGRNFENMKGFHYKMLMTLTAHHMIIL